MIVETLYDHLDNTTTNIRHTENFGDEIGYLRERIAVLENSIEHIVTALRDSPLLSGTLIPLSIQSFQPNSNMGIFPPLIQAPQPQLHPQPSSSSHYLPFQTFHQKSSQKFTKSKMDQICFKLFIQSPEPSPLQLRSLVCHISQEYPSTESRTMLSLVRKWFRKKREEVGLKAFQNLKRIFPFLLTDGDGGFKRMDFEEERNSLLKNHLSCHNSNILMQMTIVPGIEEGEVRKFVLKKLRKFISRI